MSSHPAPAHGPSDDPPLPALREDLELVSGPPSADGGPTWIVVDALRNKHFRIGWRVFQILSRWSAGHPRALLASLSRETALRLDPADVESVAKFLRANNLTASGGDWQPFLRQKRAGQHSWWQTLLHTYLFVKIPLCRPSAFLRATLPWVKPLLGSNAAYAMSVVGVLGIYLVSRQWDVFVASFTSVLNLDSVALFTIALVCVKIIHELGHAYTATRFGCRVSTMGVALLVMFPVLYTDTTAAWRLSSRRARLQIGVAGMCAELYVAALATLAWSFLPDGAGRTIAFFLASTSWVMSLAVNLNPFMRFDGYYLLSDWLGVDNLQDRAFALARWWLRELLFAIGEPRPEVFPARLERTLITYACCTWIYRFLLFVGIALLVYHLFFKLLGIVLLLVELGWFIGRPLYREVRAWYELRRRIVRTGRFKLTVLGVVALGVLFVMPWSTRVSFPAILEALPTAELYAPTPARVRELFVVRGQAVIEGAPLLQLQSPRLDTEIKVAERRVELTRLKLSRQAAAASELDSRRVLMRQLPQESAHLEGLQRRRDALRILAPFDGRVLEVADGLGPGLWVNPRAALLRLGGRAGVGLRGAVEEGQLRRLRPDQRGAFYPDDPALDALPVALVEVSPTSVQRLDVAYLAAPHGGSIEVREGSPERLIPTTAVFMVRLVPTATVLAPDQVVRGQVHLDGLRQSAAERALSLVGAVLVRELGF